MPRIRHDLFSGVKLFSGLDEQAMISLAAKAKRRIYAMGEVVYTSGTENIPLIYVVQGCIRLERQITTADTARLALTGDGETVDELSFISGQPATANAVAIEETEVLELTSEDFFSVMKKQPSMCPHLVQTMAKRLRDSSDKVQNLLALDASARLSREILVYVPLGDGRQVLDVTLPYSQEELARRIGTRRETVNRCLKEMRQDNVLGDIGRNRYRVDVPALYRTAGYTVVRTPK